MVNPLLSKYHVWMGQGSSKGRYYIVDTYYQVIIGDYATLRDAFDELRILRDDQRGKYPGILEASGMDDVSEIIEA